MNGFKILTKHRAVFVPCVIVFIVVVVLIAVVLGKHDKGTRFLLQLEKSSDGSVVAEIITDTQEGVGGIHAVITAEEALWSVDLSESESYLEGADIYDGEAKIDFMWETIEDVTLPERLCRIVLHPKTKSADTDTISMDIAEYYDNTKEMKDLPCSVTIKK